MNNELASLAAEIQLDAAAQEPLRLAFCLACVSRIQHLLESPQAVAAVETLRSVGAGKLDASALQELAVELQQVANQHRGSNSIDGSAHAAVSATYAVANAVAGRALEAASYAAYAAVYSYGGYAVNDPASFEPEVAWQVEQLRLLAATYGRDSGAV